MMGFGRPFGSLVACGGALGVGVAGIWVVGTVRPAPVMALPAVMVTALPPLPSPDSLAALLVSSPGGSRSSRGATRMLLEAIGIIEWVPSSNERAELLAEIVAMPELDSAVVAAVAQSASRISSPSARARVLRSLIRDHPQATASARRPVLEAISTMQSTPERAVTLELFVSSHRLSQGALIDALTHVQGLRADNERARVLVAAARGQRISGRARALYVRVASSMSSHQYRHRALTAIGSDAAHYRRR